MKGNNRQRVIAELVERGPMHRAELARSLSVTRTTTTNVVADGVACGVLCSGEGLKADVGISESVGFLLSVIFRAASTLVLLTRADRTPVHTSRLAIDPATPGRARMEAALACVREALGESGRRVLAAYVAVNAQIDSRSGEVVTSAASRLWGGTNPKEYFRDALGCEVIVDNEVRTSGYAQYEAGGCRVGSQLYVHLAYGIGCAQIVDGVSVRGARGGAGELGHVSIDPHGKPCECGARGCLMQYVGIRAVNERASVVWGEGADASTLAARVRSGDRVAQSIVWSLADELSEALVSALHLMNPEEVVIGGLIDGMGEVLAGPVERALLSRSLPLSVRGLSVRAAVPTDVAVAGLGVLLSMDEVCVELVNQCEVAWGNCHES